MKITLPRDSAVTADALVTRLLFALAPVAGRFDFEVRSKGRAVSFHNIRLREKKPYCGNHPAACDVAGGRRGGWLEGADWVDWNDRLNDALDVLGVSARVQSAVCIIRKGRARRTRYSIGRIGGNNVPQWAKDEPAEYWEDCIGAIALPSWYPPGTPGLYTRTLADPQLTAWVDYHGRRHVIPAEVQP